MSIKDLIAKVKKKKELSGLSESIIKETLEKKIRKYNLNLEIIKEQDIKLLIKEVRAELRLYAGRFQKSQKKRIKLLEENRIEELLKTHSSTSERISIYPDIKRIISSLNPKSILDLGCGLNPIAVAEKSFKYYAFDINASDLELVSRFFKKNKLKGKTLLYDLRKLSKPPSADLCIIFKVLDILENSYEVAEKILKSLNCKFFLISFAKKTLSGKAMKQTRRIWFEKILEKLNLHYEIFDFENEIFYLIRKHLLQ